MEQAERWLYKTLNYRFKDVGLFSQALTHRSAIGPNNERLEFLGDAVLDLVISEAVFSARPAATEGDLSKLRSSLVKESTLAELASEIGIGAHLVLGSGEHKSGGHRRESILADALEAIFAAVFLDSGIETAKRMIETLFETRLKELPDAQDLRDPKTRLQEWLQSRGLDLPTYELSSVTGKAHKQRFEVSCRISAMPGTTRGESTTRRKAEQKAAARMLENLAEDSK